ncbi:hypothetical protein FOMA001_g6394 [Fusarium oxysporum f. sp. matthiolae]|nr:hypothetical protein FOMA001_g6394 [Fusarium oxysporum f. sp. matthiolae]
MAAVLSSYKSADNSSPASRRRLDGYINNAPGQNKPKEHVATHKDE